MIHIIQKSSLEKICIDPSVKETQYRSATCLVGEEFAFQILLYSDQEKGEIVSISPNLPYRENLYLVKQVPVNWPYYESDVKDDHVLTLPGMLPDMLVPLKRGKKLKVNRVPTIIWVSMHVDYPGKFDLPITFSTDSGSVCTEFYLEALPNRIKCTDFKHVPYIDINSISASFGIPLYCDIFWNHLKKYFCLLNDHGVNTLITPLIPIYYENQVPVVNPPQLLRLFEIDKKLEFNFDFFDSWICLAQKADIDHIVIPPLFPSFKTKKCPQFMVAKEYRQVPLFGPSTNITSPEYLEFSRKLVHKFLSHLREIKFKGTVEFQFTNDPDAQLDPAYSACMEAVKLHIKDRFTDSNIVSLQKGFDSGVKSPVCFDPWSANDPIDLLIASPSARLRSLGILCYYHNIDRLYNFNINNCYSTTDLKPVNLCVNTDNERSFPSGTSFVIYPDLNGPVPSVRLKQLFFAQQDYSLLILLEKIIPRKEICSMLEQELEIHNNPIISVEKLNIFRQKVATIISNSNNV